MLYDLGSLSSLSYLQETVLALVAQRRQYARYLETRLNIEAAIAPHTKGKSTLSKTLESYTNALLPYLNNTSDRTDEEEQKVLHWWTSRKGMRVKPLWEAKKNVPGRIRSAIERGKEKVKEKEELRRSGRLKRVE